MKPQPTPAAKSAPFCAQHFPHAPRGRSEASHPRPPPTPARERSEARPPQATRPRASEAMPSERRGNVRGHNSSARERSDARAQVAHPSQPWAIAGRRGGSTPPRRPVSQKRGRYPSGRPSASPWGILCTPRRCDVKAPSNHVQCPMGRQMAARTRGREPPKKMRCQSPQQPHAMPHGKADGRPHPRQGSTKDDAMSKPPARERSDARPGGRPRPSPSKAKGPQKRPQPYSLKRYPTPRTVVMCAAICGPTLERMRRMCTSTVRVPPQYSKPHTRCSSTSRE